MRRLCEVLLLCCAALSCAAVQAQGAFPSRTVRLMVGFPPGGATDLMARLIGAVLAERFGHGVIIDNRAGATGNIAAELVARAPADGHTLLVVPAAFASNASLYAKLPFDPQRDFLPITRIAAVHNVLIVHPSVPARSVAELVDLIQRTPARFNFASAGHGSASHLAMELLRLRAKPFNVLHVPHRGMGPAVLDALAGEVDAMFATLPAVNLHLQTGKLRVLALASPQRTRLLPGVPTISESGYRGFDATAWNGVLVPAQTPRDLVVRLNLAFVEVIRQPEIRRRLAGLGADVVGDTPEAFTAYLRTEIDKWAKVVEASGARIE